MKLKSSNLVSTDFISTDQNAIRLVAATANWVVCCKTTQFAMVATNHSASSDEMRSVEIKSNEMSSK